MSKIMKKKKLDWGENNGRERKVQIEQTI